MCESDEKELQQKVDGLATCVYGIGMAQPEVSSKICRLEQDIENMTVKLKETAEATEAVRAAQKLQHTVEPKQSQQLDVKGTITLLQDSLGEQTAAMSTHRYEVASSMEEQSKHIHDLEESLQQLMARTDALEDQSKAITLAQQQVAEHSIIESISSMHLAAQRTKLEHQSLSTEVQRLSAAVFASDLPGSLQDLHAKMTACQQSVETIAGDVDSQQQRAENLQRANHVGVADLTALVRRLEDEVLKLADRVDLQTGPTQEHVNTANDDHAVQLTQTIKLVNVTDEKLSALNEVLLNTKADTAEMREILRAVQSAQHQLSDDLLHVRLGLEDRMESLEAVAMHAHTEDKHKLTDDVKTLCTSLTGVKTEVAKLQQQSQDAVNISPIETWHMELSNKVGSCCTDVQQLQTDMEQLRGAISWPECQSESNELVPTLQDQVHGMSLQITALLTLKENIVTQEQLDALLADLETAMDDIANELDAIKSRDSLKNETSGSCTLLTKGSLPPHDQLDKISAELKNLKTIADDNRHEETQLQLEALGQRVLVLADDVAALGQQDADSERMCAQTAALENRLEQVQAQVATLDAQRDQSIILELVVRITASLHSGGSTCWLSLLHAAVYTRR